MERQCFTAYGCLARSDVDARSTAPVGYPRSGDGADTASDGQLATSLYIFSTSTSKLVRPTFTDSTDQLDDGTGGNGMIEVDTTEDTVTRG